MKISMMLCAVLLTGCALKIGKDGASAVPVTPPAEAAVRVTVRSIGIHVGQNQATQTPEAQIGYQSATYDRVPTSTNRVYIAPVQAEIGVGSEGFGAHITEKFITGDAGRTNSPSPEALKTKLREVIGK
jgi:hypothetical protein